MKLYLCGPMTGMKDFNRPAFEAAEKALVGHGYEVHSPAREPDGLTWNEYMKRGITAMLACDALAVLDGGVQRSSGAALEVAIADRVGMKILTVGKWMGQMRR